MKKNIYIFFFQVKRDIYQNSNKKDQSEELHLKKNDGDFYRTEINLKMKNTSPAEKLRYLSTSK